MCPRARPRAVRRPHRRPHRLRGARGGSPHAHVREAPPRTGGSRRPERPRDRERVEGGRNRGGGGGGGGGERRRRRSGRVGVGATDARASSDAASRPRVGRGRAARPRDVPRERGGERGAVPARGHAAEQNLAVGPLVAHARRARRPSNPLVKPNASRRARWLSSDARSSVSSEVVGNASEGGSEDGSEGGSDDPRFRRRGRRRGGGVPEGVAELPTPIRLASSLRRRRTTRPSGYRAGPRVPAVRAAPS